jgi:hypothetical protein
MILLVSCPHHGCDAAQSENSGFDRKIRGQHLLCRAEFHSHKECRSTIMIAQRTKDEQFILSTSMTYLVDRQDSRMDHCRPFCMTFTLQHKYLESSLRPCNHSPQLTFQMRRQAQIVLTCYISYEVFRVQPIIQGKGSHQ